MNHSPLTRHIMRKYYNGCEENLASSVVSRGPHIQATVITLIGKKGENQKHIDVIFPLFRHLKLP